VALVTLPATAAALTPRGGHYAQGKDNVVVATFDMRIGANGAFSFAGTGIKNGILHEYSVKMSGKAVSRTAIAGSITYGPARSGA
jgi:hypothetical protein